MITVAHISDLHVGSPYFVPNLMNRVIVELNDLEPDVVICSGDLTNEGYRQEYKNWVAYAERIRAPMFTVPGNHDARNVGYLHFEELVGPRDWSADVRGVRLVGCDSSEPDLNEGQIGHVRASCLPSIGDAAEGFRAPALAGRHRAGTGRATRARARPSAGSPA